MHHVGHDVIQQTLVVRDHDRRVLLRMEFGHTRSNNTQRVDIQTRIGLVQHGQLRIEHRHLENLVFLLLAARETLVHGTARQLRVKLHDGALLAHHTQELARLQRLLTAILALLVHGHLHEVGHRHTRDLHRILESEEQSHAGTLLNRQAQQVAAQKLDRPRRNRIFGISRQHRRQRTLARPVGTHYGMHLALTHLEVYTPKYLLALNRGVQILYTQHIFFVSLSLFLHFHFSDCRYLHAVHSSKLLPCRIHTTCRHTYTIRPNLQDLWPAVSEPRRQTP